MRKAVFSSFNFAPSFVGPVMHVLQTLIDAGQRPYFITCLKSVPTCGFNIHGLSYMCEMCTYRWEINKELVKGEFDTLRMEDMFMAEDWKAAMEFVAGVTTIDKQVYFEGFDVGEAALSSYISKTRDKDVELSSDKILRDLLVNSVAVYLSVRRFLKAGNIDKVYIFNGRWDYYRAVLRAATELNIICEVFENLRTGGVLEFYGNRFPHVIFEGQKRYEKSWDDPAVSLEQKKSIAADYFQKKRDGANVFGRVFVSDQKRKMLPPGIDGSRKLIVLFNSSDDETAAVADEYKNPFFRDQVEGILLVTGVVAARKDLDLVIRMHPNLKSLSFGYLQPIYDLRTKYPNVYIVEPESPVDSYALIDAAWKVVTFGSTVGVEANYWRKPVILLARAFYFFADVAYLPQKASDVPALLLGELPAKPVEASEKIAYYFMTGGTQSKYYSHRFRQEHTFRELRLDRMSWARRNFYRLLKLFKVRTADKRPIVG